LNLREYWNLVRKRWVTIVLITVVSATAGVATTLLTPKMYASTTRVFVSTQTPETASDLLTGSNFTQQRVKSYADIVTSPKVLDPVISDLGLDLAGSDLAGRITTSVPLNTVIIEITVLDREPQTAAKIANAVSKSLTDTVTQLETPSNGQPSLVKVSVIQPGSLSQTPDSPKPLLNIALSLFIGLVLGFGTAILRDRLDLRIRSSEEVKTITGANILGSMSYDVDLPKHPLIVHSNPRSVQAEAYRQLRTNVNFVEVEGNQKSIVISSSVPSEGKTTTSCNLAIALADTGAKVLLIDCDFRKPDVHKYMGIEGSVGLTNHLIGQANLADVIQTWGAKLHVLPAGQIPPNPSELLSSGKMLHLLQSLERGYDHIVIDAAPLLPVTDAAILSKITSGVILVVGVGQTTRPQLQGAIQHIKSANGHILGTVLSKVPQRGAGSYGYGYGYGYGHGYGKKYGAVYGDSAK
jgi:capsular exopolysaccharide synthesis family protein